MAFLIKSISFSSIKVDLKHFFFQSKLHSKQPISILKTFRFSKFVLFSSSELFVPNIHILSSPKPVVCLFSKATDNYSSPYQPASPHLTTTQRLVSHLFSTSWHLFFLQPTSASSSLRDMPPVLSNTGWSRHRHWLWWVASVLPRQKLYSGHEAYAYDK